MPLVSMRQLLDHAAENGYGLPAFNVNNLEQVQAIMSAAAETNSPVIMQASAGARKYAGEIFLRHPEYHLHFTPTSSSWLNLVERFFAEITEKRIRRGAFRSVVALEQAIREYLEEHNRNPRPFIWTADADLILGRVKAICERTSDSGH